MSNQPDDETFAVDAGAVAVYLVLTDLDHVIGESAASEVLFPKLTLL